MKKIGYAQISEIGLNDEHDIGIYNVSGVDYIILGGEFTASGVRNYLRPYDKAKDKLHDREYACSKRDVAFYIDNATVSRLHDDVADIRYENNRQKW